MPREDERTKEEILLDVEIRRTILSATKHEDEYWDWKREQAKWEAKTAKLISDREEQANFFMSQNPLKATA